MVIQGIDSDSIVYLNGEYVRADEAKISVFDRGFIFGDGVYEVVPAYNRKPFRLNEHVQRLERSLNAIGLASGKTPQFWAGLMQDMIDRAKTDDSFIYLQVTRGVAKREHVFPVPAVTPTIFCSSGPFIRPTAEQRERGIRVISGPDERWLHCDIKSVSLLGNVLARQAAAERGVDEVIQFRNDLLTEGSLSNMWVVKDGTLLAPIKNHLILEGIRYGLLATLAERAGVPFEARNITRAEVFAADEILVTSATKEVLPVLELDGAPVGNGQPGPIYRKVRAEYDKEISRL